MCGIIGISSKSENIVPKMEKGLQHLKYRGYDSAGVAIVCEDSIRIKKILGADTSSLMQIGTSNRGIAHRRWATHGVPDERNQHPHISNDGTIVVVHNGTIQNYHEIRSFLENHGYKFISDCDTEVIPNLIQYYLDSTESLISAISCTTSRLAGKNSFIALIDREDSSFYAVNNGLPLVAGEREDTVYVASDARAFIDETDEGYHFDTGHILEHKNGQLKFYDLNEEEIERRKMKFELDPLDEGQGDFAHLMLKEIWDQKEGLARCMEYNAHSIKEFSESLKTGDTIYFLGCGTSYKVAAYGAMQMNRAGKRAFAYPGSEANQVLDYISSNDKVVFISQSGQTGDLIGLDKRLKDLGVETFGLINVEGSYLAESVDKLLPLKVGTETAVASTKATTAQMLLSYLMAGAVSNDYEKYLNESQNVCGDLDKFLNEKFADYIEGFSRRLVYGEGEDLLFKELFIMGKGMQIPVAKEAEIKISEVGYLGARGFAAGEIKHGYIARIKEGFPCIVLLDNETKDSVINNAIQCKTRGARIFGIGPREFKDNGIFDDYIYVPNANGLQPLLNLIPIQLIAYNIGKFQGNTIDFPRNLAKSVTVT